MKARSRKQAQILKELENNPLIERACKKVGIARSTYYRWIDSDYPFNISAETAQLKGREKMNDFVESKLLENINANSMQAIRFWLSHNTKRYAYVSAHDIYELKIKAKFHDEIAKLLSHYEDEKVLETLRNIRREVEKTL